ncbi:hypothetical protein PGT21_014585 [Puccinia graminis f. sp. tritici]|uniref:Uncharacterized protein n=1 Tax=Puccinia graminis f. sp. tritici TaxID=56615 RepID=A0A5B0QFG4_PUCGR|nr:hypothetical protein PGT21_014585 [Puccinia graminis f. sp. tritici]
MSLSPPPPMKSGADHSPVETVCPINPSLMPFDSKNRIAQVSTNQQEFDSSRRHVSNRNTREMKLSAIAHTVLVTLSLSGVVIAPGCIECPWPNCRQESTYERFKTGWKPSGPCGEPLGGGAYCLKERQKRYYMCKDCRQWSSLNARPSPKTPLHLRGCTHNRKVPLDPKTSPLCQPAQQEPSGSQPQAQPSGSQTQAPVYHKFLGLEETPQPSQPNSNAPVYHNFLGLPDHDN